MQNEQGFVSADRQERRFMPFIRSLKVAKRFHLVSQKGVGYSDSKGRQCSIRKEFLPCRVFSSMACSPPE